jgi:hypothetical protein
MHNASSELTFLGRANQFTKIWRGGYFEGDPLDPTTSSSYIAYGYNSFLYTVYLVCIKPYITKQSVVLEIGPGRGAWTKTFLHLGAKKIWCLDAAPPEHTGFYEYVGKHDSITYICVSDARLTEIDNDSIDFFFSFGVFCHLPQSIISDYLRHLASKMKSGAHCFLMVGDFEKYNKCIEESISIFAYRSRWVLPFKLLWKVLKAIFPSKYTMKKLIIGDELALADETGFGRWYHLSTDDACNLIESCGFTVVERDMNVSQRDPVIHFVKS